MTKQTDSEITTTGKTPYDDMSWNEIGKRLAVLIILVSFVTFLLWLNASNFDHTELRVVMWFTIGSGFWIMGVPVLKVLRIWKK